jgi:hypothetical protein
MPSPPPPVYEVWTDSTYLTVIDPTAQTTVVAIVETIGGPTVETILTPNQFTRVPDGTLTQIRFSAAGSPPIFARPRPNGTVLVGPKVWTALQPKDISSHNPYEMSYIDFKTDKGTVIQFQRVSLDDITEVVAESTGPIAEPTETAEKSEKMDDFSKSISINGSVYNGLRDGASLRVRYSMGGPGGRDFTTLSVPPGSATGGIVTGNIHLFLSQSAPNQDTALSVNWNLAADAASVDGAPIVLVGTQIGKANVQIMRSMGPPQVVGLVVVVD